MTSPSIPNDQARSIVADQADLAPAALQFTPVDKYTTFRAEYAVDGEDLVYHFFNTPEHVHDDVYWTKGFPQVLEVIAVDCFKAGPPRLKAAYVKEWGIDSWWLRAQGFALVGDPEVRSARFFQMMDQGLDKIITNTR